MIGQDNPLSFGNHEGYIANRSGFDNEAARHEKGPPSGPFMHCVRPLATLGCRFGTLWSGRTLGLGNAGLLPAQPAQVIKLGTAHLAAAHDLDRPIIGE